MKRTTANGVGRGLVRLVIGVLVGGLVGVSAAAQGKVDVTGKWVFDVSTSAGSGAPTMTFKQDGETLSGAYEGQLGQANLKGTVKGQAISFSFTVDAQGQSADVTYVGTVESDSMKGSVDIAGQVFGTFTAKRQ